VPSLTLSNTVVKRILMSFKLIKKIHVLKNWFKTQGMWDAKNRKIYGSGAIILYFYGLLFFSYVLQSLIFLFLLDLFF
jgi:hypothetical protein